jgi:hypothetical protein
MKIALWILGALAGVVLAAGVTYAASSLSTQRIGLSSEPANAGQDLAPRRTATPTPTPAHRKKRKRPRPTPTATPRATATAAPTTIPTVDDHGGERGDDSGGHGGGGGGDD